LLSTPQLRPGSIYYLGIKANNDAVFTISNNVAGGTFPLYSTINFYGGSVTNVLAANSEITYRIYAPRDATRWIHNATHVSGVKLYLENGYLPLKTAADDWQSPVANSSLNQYLLSGWPWEPNANYYLTITNTTGTSQPYAFVMDGRNALTDDNDVDGMLMPGNVSTSPVRLHPLPREIMMAMASQILMNTWRGPTLPMPPPYGRD